MHGDFSFISAMINAYTTLHFPVVGLTGGIGSGKSTAADVFRSLGVPVIDADAISRTLTGPLGEGALAVAHAFGDEFLDDSRALNRERMRTLVFDDSDAKKRLEGILHPLIERDVRQALATLPQDTPYAVFDCPLLLEGGIWRSLVSRVLVIDLCEEEAVRRVILRSHLTAERIRSILRTQCSRSVRLDAADDLIYNGTTRDALTHRIKLLHKLYRAM